MAKKKTNLKRGGRTKKKTHLNEMSMSSKGAANKRLTRSSQTTSNVSEKTPKEISSKKRLTRSSQTTSNVSEKTPKEISSESPTKKTLKTSNKTSNVSEKTPKEISSKKRLTRSSQTTSNVSEKTPKEISSESPTKKTLKTSNKTSSNVTKSTEKKTESLDNKRFKACPDKRRKTPCKTSKITQKEIQTENKSSTLNPNLSETSSRGGRLQQRRSSVRVSVMEPRISLRKVAIRKDSTDIQLAKESLHVSAVTKTLPCREEQFKEVYSFIESTILRERGDCMYICGNPGTGKTVTITQVIKSLQLQVKRKKIPEFHFIEINGMRLTEPRQAYVHIYRQLSGKTVPWEQAYSTLDKLTKKASKSKTIVLLIDEFDMIFSRRQDVIYNLLDWSRSGSAQLIIIAISNTVHMPEQWLSGSVASRLGSQRLVFSPYSHKELQQIVQTRLVGTSVFDDDAIQLVAKKVASISGDCRRALDICRRAVEIAEVDCAGREVIVSMSIIEKTFDEMFNNPKIVMLKSCSKYEQLFLQAVVAEVARTGSDEAVLLKVHEQFESICTINGLKVPGSGFALRISCRLCASRLLICEHSNASIHQKIILNVSQDDISYAFHVNNNA